MRVSEWSLGMGVSERSLGDEGFGMESRECSTVIVTCLHVVLEHVNDSSLIFFIILVSVQRSEESFRYTVQLIK